MNYKDVRDDIIAELAAVLRKYNGIIEESEDGELIVSIPPTKKAEAMGAAGLYFYVREIQS